MQNIALYLLQAVEPFERDKRNRQYWIRPSPSKTTANKTLSYMRTGIRILFGCSHILCRCGANFWLPMHAVNGELRTRSMPPDSCPDGAGLEIAEVIADALGDPTEQDLDEADN